MQPLCTGLPPTGRDILLADVFFYTLPVSSNASRLPQHCAAERRGGMQQSAHKLQVFFDVLNYKNLCANCLSVPARFCVRSEWGTLERITYAEIDTECFESGRDIVVSGDRARQIRLAFLVIFVSLVRRVNTYTYIQSDYQSVQVQA